MNSNNYITIFENEQEAKNHAKPRWQDGKFRPTEKAERLLLKPNARMKRAEAARESAWQEMMSYG